MVWWCIWARNFATSDFAIEMCSRAQLAAAKENPFLQSTWALQEPTRREPWLWGAMHKVPYSKVLQNCQGGGVPRNRAFSPSLIVAPTLHVRRKQNMVGETNIAKLEGKYHSQVPYVGRSLDSGQLIFLTTRLCC